MLSQSMTNNKRTIDGRMNNSIKLIISYDLSLVIDFLFDLIVCPKKTIEKICSANLF